MLRCYTLHPPANLNKKLNNLEDWEVEESEGRGKKGGGGKEEGRMKGVKGEVRKEEMSGKGGGGRERREGRKES